MSDAPEKIWHAIDRKGKISGSPDAHVKPCADVIDAYEEYTHRAALDALAAERDALRDALEAVADTADGQPGALVQECRQIARTALRAIAEGKE